MPTRREMLKGGGGAVLGGWRGLPPAPHVVGDGHGGRCERVLGGGVVTGAAAVPGFRPGGPGPLYWSTYDYEKSRTPSSLRPCGRRTSTGWRTPSATTATPWCVPTDGSTGRRRSPARLHRQPGGRLGARLGLVGRLPEGQGDAARRLLQPPVGHQVGGDESVRHRRRAARRQGGRHRQRERLFRRGRAAAVGGHHPGRRRGVREGLRGLLPRARSRVPPHRLPGLLRDRFRPERRHRRGRPRPGLRICRRCSGCGRRRRACSSAS